MSATVPILDYGIGNLHSVCRAVEVLGATPKLISTAAEVEQAERLILPGVGAFAHGMQALQSQGLDAALKRLAEEKKPLLGICLGMQLLFEVAEEFGEHEGLGLLPGRVVPVPKTGADGQPHKVPHIGWNQLERPEHWATWQGSLLANTPEQSPMYFVHSFMAAPAQPAMVLAVCDYNGQAITAAVQLGNLMGTQFHPEKSGPTGLAILETFLTWPGQAGVKASLATRLCSQAFSRV